MYGLEFRVGFRVQGLELGLTGLVVMDYCRYSKAQLPPYLGAITLRAYRGD